MEHIFFYRRHRDEYEYQQRHTHISSRKADHIDLCIDGDVSFKRKTTLFEEIQLIHNALPELQVSDVDLRCHFAGHTFEAPLIIAAMTGGVDRANEINKDHSKCKNQLDDGFAFGSQRPLLSRNNRWISCSRCSTKCLCFWESRCCPSERSVSFIN